MKEWLASIFELCLYHLMQKLNPFRVDSASRPILPDADVLSLPPRPSSSPARATREADRLDASASRPVRPSPAAGTAGAAAPRGSGPQSRPTGCRFPIRTRDGIPDEPTKGRAVCAPGRTSRPG
ncbi:hypothetical protein FJ967_29130 [Mesorhizobium sp. B2-3-4]|nr:hypothetical protein FJ967_29130 [Mesorhizobium sp. B2-3-4]